MKRSGVKFIAAAAAVLVVGGLAVKLVGGGVAPIPAAFAGGMTIQQGIERGTRSGKPVLILATADRCGVCQRFKRGPVSDAKVAAFIAEHFEAVYLNVDRDSQLAEKLEIESIPAMRVLRPGKPPGRLDGYVEADRLAIWLQNALGA